MMRGKPLSTVDSGRWGRGPYPALPVPARIPHQENKMPDDDMPANGKYGLKLAVIKRYLDEQDFESVHEARWAFVQDGPILRKSEILYFQTKIQDPVSQPRDLTVSTAFLESYSPDQIGEYLRTADIANKLHAHSVGISTKGLKIDGQ